MYNCIPVHTLQTMQDFARIDHKTLRYLAAGVIALLLLIAAAVASV